MKKIICFVFLFLVFFHSFKICAQEGEVCDIRAQEATKLILESLIQGRLDKFGENNADIGNFSFNSHYYWYQNILINNDGYIPANVNKILRECDFLNMHTTHRIDETTLNNMIVNLTGIDKKFIKYNSSDSYEFFMFISMLGIKFPFDVEVVKLSSDDSQEFLQINVPRCLTKRDKNGNIVAVKLLLSNSLVFEKEKSYNDIVDFSFYKNKFEGKWRQEENLMCAIPVIDFSFTEDFFQDIAYSWLKEKKVILNDNAKDLMVINNISSSLNMKIEQTGIIIKAISFLVLTKQRMFCSPERTIKFSEVNRLNKKATLISPEIDFIADFPCDFEASVGGTVVFNGVLKKKQL